MQHLLSEFEYADITKWERQVLKDLGLESIEQLTQIHLSDEIIQAPYIDFTSDLRNQLQHSYRHSTTNSGERWQGARYWLNMERLVGLGAAKLNQLSLSALAGGADGIILVVDGVKDWEQLLEGISLSHCYLGVEAELKDILELVKFLDSIRSNPQGFFVINGQLNHLTNENQDLLELLNKSSNCRTLTLRESVIQPGTINELVLLLSQGIYTINTLLEANISMSTILENIQINLLLSDAYLWEICRLRCLRILFHQVVQQYGATDYLPGSLTIQATTNGYQSPVGNASVNSQFQHSPKAGGVSSGKLKNGYQQLLRNTTQTMAAVLGGCNIVTVVPQHGFNSDDLSSRRIARNVSHILKEECNLHRMADPVAGSYYLEDLTDKLLREVWSRLQQLEGSGGYLNGNKSRI